MESWRKRRGFCGHDNSFAIRAPRLLSDLTRRPAKKRVQRGAVIARVAHNHMLIQPAARKRLRRARNAECVIRVNPPADLLLIGVLQRPPQLPAQLPAVKARIIRIDSWRVLSRNQQQIKRNLPGRKADAAPFRRPFGKNQRRQRRCAKQQRRCCAGDSSTATRHNYTAKGGYFASFFVFSSWNVRGEWGGEVG